MNEPAAMLRPLPAQDDESLARRSAHILGGSSAAHKALAEMDQRRAGGEDVGIWLLDRTWVVGPLPC